MLLQKIVIVGWPSKLQKAAIQCRPTTLFKYFMFSRGGIAPNNQYIPADDSIGSGSLLAIDRERRRV